MDKFDFNSFYMALRKQLKSVNMEINKKLAELGLSSQHAVYLMALSKHENIKVKELNDVVGNDGAITTRILHTLFSNEFIAKSDESIRKCKIYLTNKGKALLESLNNIFYDIKDKAMAKLTLEDVMTLQTIAKKLTND